VRFKLNGFSGIPTEIEDVNLTLLTKRLIILDEDVARYLCGCGCILVVGETIFSCDLINFSIKSIG